MRSSLRDGVFVATCLLLLGACGTADSNPFADDRYASQDSADGRTVSPPEERKRVFFLHSGTMGKIRDSSDRRPPLDVADEDCTLAAADRDLGGAWRAWLSSSEADAIERIDDVGPWFRVDRETLLFPDRAGFRDGPIAEIVPEADPDRSQFWSGTLPDGTRSGENCDDWTEYLGLSGTVGRVDVAGPSWATPESLYCGIYLALLCIEQ